MKRVAPEHEVVVYERNRPAETFGFGVVFSDATLGHLAAADPETHAQITARFARWDDIEIHVEGEVLRSTGHGFCGLERKTLLQILQARAAELGVRVEYEHEVKRARRLSDADVIVASDGVASWVREALAADLEPPVDVRPNKFVWLGCTVPYRAFTFLFEDTPHGMFRVHAYRYHEHGSTFIVECRERRPGARRGSRPPTRISTLAILGEIFADELGGHRLIKNRSIWRNFPTVRCAAWSSGNVVLVGDAAHTAHFSIGSGTKLAMEDVIVLRDELLATRDVPRRARGVRGAAPARGRGAAGRRAGEPRVVRGHRALRAHGAGAVHVLADDAQPARLARVGREARSAPRARRRAAARREGRSRAAADRDPSSSIRRRTPTACAAAAALPLPIAPTALPFPLGDKRAPNRIAIAAASTHAGELAGDDDLVALGGAAAAGAGAVITPAIAIAATPLAGPRINTDEQAVAWRRIVEFVHGKDALVVARIATAGAVPGALEAAVQRAAFAGLRHGRCSIRARPRRWRRDSSTCPALVQAARRRVAEGSHDRRVDPRSAARARRPGAGTPRSSSAPGASLLVVTSRGDALMAGARLPAAPLADQLRNELAVATAIVADATRRCRISTPRSRRGARISSSSQQMPGGFTKR